MHQKVIVTQMFMQILNAKLYAELVTRIQLM